MFFLSIIHIAFGTAAFFAGVGALWSRKGGLWHRRFGRTFAVSMITTALAGVVLALILQQAITALAGWLAIYLVLTGWVSLRERDTLSSVLQVLATGTVVLVSIGTLAIGFLASHKISGTYQGFAAGDYFYLALIAILATGGDLYWYASGGYTGKRRLARHLWRMCAGMFFATGSLFTGPGAVIFPEILQDSGLLALPELTVLSLMIFWLVRVRRSSNAKISQKNKAAE